MQRSSLFQHDWKLPDFAPQRINPGIVPSMRIFGGSRSQRCIIALILRLVQQDRLTKLSHPVLAIASVPLIFRRIRSAQTFPLSVPPLSDCMPSARPTLTHEPYGTTSHQFFLLQIFHSLKGEFYVMLPDARKLFQSSCPPHEPPRDRET